MKDDTKQVLGKIIAANESQNELLRVQNARLNELEDSVQGLVDTFEVVVEILELIAIHVEKQNTIQKQIVDHPIIKPGNPQVLGDSIMVKDLPGWTTTNTTVFPIQDWEWTDDGTPEAGNADA